MILSISGKTFRKTDKKLMKKALYFFIDQLIDKKLKSKLNISLKFDPNLTDNNINNWQLLGECQPLTYAAKPRKFIIRLNSSQSEDEMISTLAHEIVHVKQYATGALRPVDWTFTTDSFKWKGKIRDIAYLHQPWEAEARRIEKKLHRKFLNLLDKEKRKE